MANKTRIAAAMMLVSVFAVGCSKKQVIPSALAGTGGVVFGAGVVYRVSRPDEEPEDPLLGERAEERAVTATLLSTGLALMIAGVIWSVTTPVCEVDADCWGTQVCDKKSGTCVAPQQRPAPLPDEVPLTPPGAPPPQSGPAPGEQPPLPEAVPAT